MQELKRADGGMDDILSFGRCGQAGAPFIRMGMD